MTKTITYKITAIVTIDTTDKQQAEYALEDGDLSDFDIDLRTWDLIEESDDW